ncbi:transcriptional regulator, TetR family [Desulfatibacillum alkenivorans DSM 16219]|jgi:AcrR family transcriptional regulator|uniref:Transcriptional regulator, TetR family n=1 Tax=Desulfatibacillum alkenivorans DSM 16219 TaxID=1121393 RepID=A0A1M6X2L1_9BACT|nr:TetR/AcrR family transcriptional regulator [Desulfatibacillum alkenivorans]SHL00247.1 transcriptional regulator, TetR family [Desulfatibacillum alkenivorans DSM 16219]
MPKQHATFASLKEEERKARQRVIVDAAERVFGKKPFEQVSMREIAQEAGIAASSIYRYFPDQQSLFVEAFVQGTKEIIHRVDQRIADGGISNLSDFVLIYIDFLIEHDHHFRMMANFMMGGQLSGPLLEKLNQAARSILEQFDRIIEGNAKPEQLRLHSHALFAALNGILISFRNYPGREPQDVRRHMEKLAKLAASMCESHLKSGA